MNRLLRRGTSRWVLGLLLLFAVTLSLTARSVVRSNESQLLAERANEVGAQLTSSLAYTEASLQSLGTLATLPDSLGAFETAANSLMVGPVRALVLLQPRGTGFAVQAMVGDGPPAGAQLPATEVALFRRAQLGPRMVSAVTSSGYRSRLGFAISMAPDKGGAIVYQEDAIDPSNPIAATGLPPGNQLSVSFYASTSPSAATLVLASEWPHTSVSGYARRVQVGADQWTVVVQAERPLSGSLAQVVPWLLLAGGVVSALLAAGLVEVLVRRRDFAIGLVEERTGELRDSLQSLEAAQTELRHRAFHDGLTGLPNRVLLMDRIERALELGAYHNSSAAILFMDIDRFKWVNDSLGHAAGDEILVEVAERLRAAVRPRDTVARLGGDEFVVLCEDVPSEEEAARLAQRMAERISEPIQVHGHRMCLTVSVGVALGAAAVTAHELLRDGDIAMYQAKDRGRDRVEILSSDMRSRAASRLPAEAALRAALDNGEIGVHFQPIVSPADGTVAGVEALARWTDRNGTVHSPDQFIGIAEETGLIVPLGAGVLDRACTQVGRWNRDHPDRRPLSVSVNLSARQLESEGLTGMVQGVLATSGIDPRHLWLEITETVLMDERGPALAALNSLSELGVTLVVDDFGTGYSSLLYLHRLPVNVLKIDQSFVAGMGRRQADDAIVTSVVTLAHDLGVIAVAEGVETATQAAGLARLGCDLAQGYFWSHPSDADSLTPWLERSWPTGEERREAEHRLTRA